MGPVRGVLQLAAYKPVTDMLFSMLAIKAHFQTEAAERSESQRRTNKARVPFNFRKMKCSEGSTNERNNAGALARRIVKNLKDSIQVLRNIEAQFDTLTTALLNAGGIHQVKEFHRPCTNPQ